MYLCITSPQKGQLDRLAAAVQSKLKVPAREHCFFFGRQRISYCCRCYGERKIRTEAGKGIATLHLEFDRPARTRMSDCTLILHLKAPLYLTLMSPTKVLGSSHTYMNLPSCQLFASSLLTFQPGQRKSSQRWNMMMKTWWKEKDWSAGFHINEFGRESPTSRIRKISPCEAH